MAFDDYRSKLDTHNRALAAAIEAEVTRCLPQAVGKVWHGHPVWFIDGNPVVGYSLKKSGMRVLWWSGQSFTTPGLAPVGSFKAAEFAPLQVDDVRAQSFERWLVEAVNIQWDYKNLPKNRALVKLTDF